ncbi:MAG TPA: hypothetical protein VI821_00165 [Candidatus Paceibacterota bacterium]
MESINGDFIDKITDIGNFAKRLINELPENETIERLSRYEGVYNSRAECALAESIYYIRMALFNLKIQTQIVNESNLQSKQIEQIDQNDQSDQNEQNDQSDQNEQILPVQPRINMAETYVDNFIKEWAEDADEMRELINSRRQK